MDGWRSMGWMVRLEVKSLGTPGGWMQNWKSAAFKKLFFPSRSLQQTQSESRSGPDRCDTLVNSLIYLLRDKGIHHQSKNKESGQTVLCVPPAWVIIQRTERGMRRSVQTFRCRKSGSQRWGEEGWENKEDKGGGRGGGERKMGAIPPFTWSSLCQRLEANFS